jgi:hypothetical protein
MITYATLIVFGYYGSSALFGMALGVAAPKLVEKGLSEIYVVVAIFAVGILIGLAIPTASYLVGEWIGRSLTKRRDALLVAVGAPLLSHTLYWGLGHFLIITFKETLEASQGGMTSALQYGWAIIIALNLLSIIFPMLVGAYRGATHKPFYAGVKERVLFENECRYFTSVFFVFDQKDSLFFSVGFHHRLARSPPGVFLAKFSRYPSPTRSQENQRKCGAFRAEPAIKPAGRSGTFPAPLTGETPCIQYRQ